MVPSLLQGLVSSVEADCEVPITYIILMMCGLLIVCYFLSSLVFKLGPVANCSSIRSHKVA